MQSLLRRATPKRELVLLAPLGSNIPGQMTGLSADSNRYEQLLGSMQKLRGQVYRQDGALTDDQLTTDGRHLHVMDDRAWHILCVEAEGKVVGCARYMAHENTVSFSQLGIVESDLAKSRWGGNLRRAVESEIQLARRLGVAYVEVGGWAISPDLGNSCEALRIAFATYALARMLGGCIGIGTVTQRHMSSAILRKVGGCPLIDQSVELPAYFDRSYGCQMEILRFSSMLPSARFETWIHDLEQYLHGAAIYLPEVFSLQNLHKAIAGHQEEAVGPWTYGSVVFSSQNLLPLA